MANAQPRNKPALQPPAKHPVKHPTKPSARTAKAPSPRALGALQRKTLPRTDLAKWDVKLRRRTPSQLLDESTRGRLAELLPLKRQRMSASPFGFFRGAVPVMAYDLSLSPSTGIHVQLCGDAHVQNLGAFCGIGNALIFDINDFDETIRGPFEFDVKRMAASIVLAANSAKIKRGPAVAAVQLFLAAYSGMMQRLSRMPVLAVARFQVHRLATVEPISAILLKAEHETPALALTRLTEETAQGRIFRTVPQPAPAPADAPPLLRPATAAEGKAVLAALPAYVATLLPERRHFFAQFKPIAVGFKVVGTGSVGLRDFCVYLQGNGAADPLFLQIKEEARSAWSPYIRNSESKHEHDGQRAAEGQRAMQFQSDPLLGWTRIGGRDYLVRQLNDHKASVDMTTLKAAGLEAYAQVCGEILARGHARSGDARVIAGYIGKGTRFKQGITGFANAYAAQTIADWKAYTAEQGSPAHK